MHERRFAKLNTTFKPALRDCFAKHPEWFAGGDVQSIERSIIRTLKLHLLDVLQLSYGYGVLACVYR